MPLSLLLSILLPIQPGHLCKTPRETPRCLDSGGHSAPPSSSRKPYYCQSLLDTSDTSRQVLNKRLLHCTCTSENRHEVVMCLQNNSSGRKAPCLAQFTPLALVSFSILLGCFLCPSGLVCEEDVALEVLVILYCTVQKLKGVDTML